MSSAMAPRSYECVNVLGLYWFDLGAGLLGKCLKFLGVRHVFPLSGPVGYVLADQAEAGVSSVQAP